MSSVLRSVQSALAPTERTSSTSVSVSRMRGTFVSVTGCSVRSEAAMIGSAAFLFPDGRMVPESVASPSTTYCTAAMSWECSEGGSCLTLDFGANTIRDHLNPYRLAWPQRDISLAHARGRRQAARMTRWTPKGNTSIPLSHDSGFRATGCGVPPAGRTIAGHDRYQAGGGRLGRVRERRDRRPGADVDRD